MYSNVLTLCKHFIAVEILKCRVFSLRMLDWNMVSSMPSTKYFESQTALLLGFWTQIYCEFFLFLIFIIWFSSTEFCQTCQNSFSLSLHEVPESEWSTSRSYRRLHLWQFPTVRPETWGSRLYPCLPSSHFPTAQHATYQFWLVCEARHIRNSCYQFAFAFLHCQRSTRNNLHCCTPPHFPSFPSLFSVSPFQPSQLFFLKWLSWSSLKYFRKLLGWSLLLCTTKAAKHNHSAMILRMMPVWMRRY